MYINVVIFAVLLTTSEADKKFWKFTTDILNPNNWNNADDENCNGVKFAPDNSASIAIEHLQTDEITLPYNGDVEIIDGGEIQFKTNKKCLKLLPINRRNWFDSDNWQSSNDKNNVAVPHKERLPCNHDDVYLPQVYHTSITMDYPSTINIKSIQFNGTQPTDYQLMRLRSTTAFSGYTDFNVHHKKCEHPWGCFCHIEPYPCVFNKPAESDKFCLKPIDAINFCHKICGATVKIWPKTGFKLTKIQQKLAKYSVDTYASRVLNEYYEDFIQVVFREKEYTGKSADEAKLLFEELTQETREYYIKKVEIEDSGPYYIEGQAAKTTILLLFGTLVAVLIVFGVIFYLNGEIGNRFDLIRLPRFGRGGRGSLFNTPFFARFDNTDENLIIDSQSIAASVADLTRSFDNPMYGKSTTTSSSSSSLSDNKTEDSPDNNPLYDVVLKKNDNIGDIEE